MKSLSTSTKNVRTHEQQPTTALQTNNRKRSIAGLVLLCTALLGGGFLRGMQADGKGRLECDEGISFVVATGHQAEYNRVIKERIPPYGEWVEAEEWKRLFRIEESLCFSKIGTELTQYDIHPPLYFWLLHLWIMVFGVHVWTGPALNMVIGSGTMVVLFLLGRHATRDPLAGGVVAFLWAFSPTVILASNEARQYDCLGFCTALLAWQVVRCLDTERRLRWGSLALLSGATTMGLLTHYHFSLLLVGIIILFAVYFLKKHTRRFFACCAALVVGGLFFALLHPRFLESIERGRARMQTSGGLNDFSIRAEEVLMRYASFIVDTPLYTDRIRTSLEYCVLGVFSLLAAATFFVHVKNVLRQTGHRELFDQRAIQVFFLFMWAASLNVLLYMAGVSPIHAMEPKYPSMVYPLLPVAIVLMVWLFRRVRTVVLLMLCCVLLGTSSYSVFYRRATNQQKLPLANAIHQADAIVIDNPSILFVPALTINVPDQTPMFIAKSDDLLTHFSKWPDGLGIRSLLISWTRDRDDTTKAEGILALLRKKFHQSIIGRRLVGGRGVLVLLVRKSITS